MSHWQISIEICGDIPCCFTKVLTMMTTPKMIWERQVVNFEQRKWCQWVISTNVASISLIKIMAASNIPFIKSVNLCVFFKSWDIDWANKCTRQSSLSLQFDRQVLRRNIIWQRCFGLKYMSTIVQSQDYVLTWKPFLHHGSFMFVIVIIVCVIDIAATGGAHHINGVIVNVIFIVNMMTSSNGNNFRVTGHLCGEFIGPWWIPRTKASDAGLWCFLWSAFE